MPNLHMQVPVLNAMALSALGEKGSESLRPRGHTPGMQISNANGNIDTSSQGYQYTVSTTTYIHAKTIEQKFYELDGRQISDYIPVEMGVGAWMEDVKTNLTYIGASDSFESGLQSINSGPDRIANMDIGLSPVNAKVHTWVYGFKYSTPEINKALATNNWNVVESKAAGLKKIFDLGLQKLAFLGLRGELSTTPGLLSNTSVTINSASLLTGFISDMDATTFATFVAAVLAVYRANAYETCMPNRFVIPMADFVGLATPVSSGFPIVSKLTYLEDAFKRICGQDFQILPLAYANAANNAGYWAVAGTNRYVLYRHDPEVVKMDLPISFTLNAPGTSDNFSWNTVSYAQFTGAIAYRVPQMLYIDYVPGA